MPTYEDDNQGMLKNYHTRNFSADLRNESSNFRKKKYEQTISDIFQKTDGSKRHSNDYFEYNDHHSADMMNQ